MKTAKKNKERKKENASSVCFLNSPEIRPEYKNEDENKPEAIKKSPPDDSHQRDR